MLKSKPILIHPYLTQYARLLSLIGTSGVAGHNTRERRAAIADEMKRLPSKEAFRKVCLFDIAESWHQDRRPDATRNVHNRKERWIKAYRVFHKYHPKSPHAIRITWAGRDGVYVIHFVDAQSDTAAAWDKWHTRSRKLGIPNEEIERLRVAYERDDAAAAG